METRLDEASPASTTTGAFPLSPDGKPAPHFSLVRDADRPAFPVLPIAALQDRPVLAILGAGYTGLAAALRLAELNRAAGGPAHVVLLEAGYVGGGASGKSAGQICGLQASDESVRRRCPGELAGRLIAAAERASRLVRELVARHDIPCDLRDGFVSIAPDGSQTVSHGGLVYGIDPYPYVLGLAFAAARMGASIFQHCRVLGIAESGGRCLVRTEQGPLLADRMIAAGGHRMMRDVRLLAPLLRRTCELRVATIMTDPVPVPLIDRIMPGSRRYPFAGTAADVAYGTVTRDDRLVFGSRAASFGGPALPAIAADLGRMFPDLWRDYRDLTGRELGYVPLVGDETLCFTRAFLPNLGIAGREGRVLFAHALGGHGVALGTLLGTACAERLWRDFCGDAGRVQDFDDFAAVPHGWLPSRQPWRSAAAWIGLRLRR